MDTKDMTLREVCQTLEVSRRAIQGYEKAGLVSATSKNKYGHLLYNKTARDRVAKIKLYQRFGFTIKEIQGIVDESKDSTSWLAFNEEGYELSLSYYEYSKELSIALKEPMEFVEITWPKSEAGQQVPVPKSNMGQFSYESADDFYVYVTNMTRADYSQYIEECMERGFTIDYQKGDTYYYADNSSGWHVSVTYEGNNVITISVKKAEEDEWDEEEEEESEETEEVEKKESKKETKKKDTKKETTVDGMRPEFKEAMDSYEKFMGEYVEIMKKYNANPNDMSLLTDYTNYMIDYTEFCEDFEKWNSEEMNDAELAYYLEVQTRVNQKLLELSQ